MKERNLLKNLVRDFSASTWFSLTLLVPIALLAFFLFYPDQPAEALEQHFETPDGLRKLQQIIFLSFLGVCIFQTQAMGLLNIFSSRRYGPNFRRQTLSHQDWLGMRMKEQAFIPTNFPIAIALVTWTIIIGFVLSGLYEAREADILHKKKCIDYFFAWSCYSATPTKTALVLLSSVVFLCFLVIVLASSRLMRIRLLSPLALLHAKGVPKKKSREFLNLPASAAIGFGASLFGLAIWQILGHSDAQLLSATCEEYFPNWMCAHIPERKMALLLLYTLIYLVGILAIWTIFLLELKVAQYARIGVRSVTALRRISLFAIFPPSVLFFAYYMQYIVANVSQAKSFSPLFILIFAAFLAGVLLSAIREIAFHTSGAGVGLLIALATVIFLGAPSSDWPARIEAKDQSPGRLAHEYYAFSQQKPPGAPTYLVSAQGGGLLAAYHAAMALARLEDQCRFFHKSIFGASLVSGGALGVSVFVAAVDAVDEAFPEASTADAFLGSCHPSPKIGDLGAHEALVEKFFESEFITPLLAGLLFRDFPRQFYNASATAATWAMSAAPLSSARKKNHYRDRAALLEDTLARQWSRTIRWLAAQTGRNIMRENFFERSIFKIGQSLPILVFGVVAVDTGESVYISETSLLSEHFPRPYVKDLRQLIGPYDLKVKTAIVLSARFPFICPPGYATGTGDKSGVKVRLVDGGYFDNSGASVTSLMVRSMRRMQPEDKVVPIAFLYDKEEPYSWSLASELSGVVLGLVNSRLATSRYWRNEAEFAAGQGIGSQFPKVGISFYLPNSNFPARLAWSLSRKSKNSVRDAIWPWAAHFNLPPELSSDPRIKALFRF